MDVLLWPHCTYTRQHHRYGRRVFRSLGPYSLQSWYHSPALSSPFLLFQPPDLCFSFLLGFRICSSGQRLSLAYFTNHGIFIFMKIPDKNNSTGQRGSLRRQALSSTLSSGEDSDRDQPPGPSSTPGAPPRPFRQPRSGRGRRGESQVSSQFLHSAFLCCWLMFLSKVSTMKRCVGCCADPGTHGHLHRRPSLSHTPFYPTASLQGRTTGTDWTLSLWVGLLCTAQVKGAVCPAINMPS